MTKYIIRRILMVVGVLWMVATLTYFTVHVTPGDTATAVLYELYGEDAVNTENLERVREKYDLNESVFKQYAEWVKNAFTGNFGTSYRYNKPVSYMIGLRLPNTLKLGFTAFVFSVVIAIPLGIISALKHNKLFDHMSRIFVLITSSFPAFWVAIVLIIVCSLKAKGLTRNKIIVRHILRNAIPPIIAVLGLQIGHILGGAVVIENIFSWPGVGGLFIDAINAKDMPMIEGCVLVIAFGYAAINLVVDIIYAAINPEIRYSGEAKK